MITDVVARGQSAVEVVQDCLLRVGLHGPHDDSDAILLEKALCSRPHTTGNDELDALLSQPPGQKSGLVLW